MIHFFKKRKKIFIIMLILLIAAFIPTPYYIYGPGPLYGLADKVTIKGQNKEGKGNFYLTTVESAEASNIYFLAYGLLAKHTEIKTGTEIKQDLTDEEYEDLLAFMMRDSKQNAIVAAFSQAGIKVNLDYQGIFVANIMEKSKAKGILKVGDTIIKVDGQEMFEKDQFTQYIGSHKKAGDDVNITIIRNGKTLDKKLEVITLDPKPKKIGLGIIPEEDFTVKETDHVKLKSDDIGGPSAGLMFSLELYRQLKGEDITRGYEIAGTGTIDHKGNVGQIGGIRHKITAADSKGIDIFFVPKDINKIDTNEKDAKAEVKENNYKIKTVPVASLSEAIDYLENLQMKNN